MANNLQILQRGINPVVLKKELQEIIYPAVKSAFEALPKQTISECLRQGVLDFSNYGTAGKQAA